VERIAILPDRDAPTLGASVVAVLPGVLKLLKRVADRKAVGLLTRGDFPQVCNSFATSACAGAIMNIRSAYSPAAKAFMDNVRQIEKELPA
jgi:hypothetical protein